MHTVEAKVAMRVAAWGALVSIAVAGLVVVAVRDGGAVTTDATTPPALGVGAAPTTTDVVRIDFSDAASTPAPGYTRDIGDAYGPRTNGLTYGWVDQGTTTPRSIVGNGRARAGTDRRLATHLLVQAADLPKSTARVSARAAWEIAVPDGRYTVTVGVGDSLATDSTHAANIEGVAAITRFVSTSTVPYAIATRTADVRDGRLTVDAIGGTNTKFGFVDVARVTGTTTDVVKIDFSDAAATPASGYTRDIGEAYGPRTSGLTYGWVDQGTTTPRSIVGNGRTRTGTDRKLDSFIHMQAADLPASPTRIAARAAWEIAVPNGTYTIIVGVGDGAAFDSNHWLRVEGRSAIVAFSPNRSTPFRVAQRTVEVRDGRLTVDAIGGTNTKLGYLEVSTGSPAARPYVVATEPADGAWGVTAGAGFAITTTAIGTSAGDGRTGLVNGTVTAASVILRTLAGVVVPTHANSTGGGDAITVTPSVALAPNTTYVLEMTPAITDLAGRALVPFTTTFTTGTSADGGGLPTSPVAFVQRPQATSTGRYYTSLTIGPDRRLYAGVIDGTIVRFDIAADGTLGAPLVITTVPDHHGGAPRMLIGLAFVPGHGADDLQLLVSHSEFGFQGVGPIGAPYDGGKLSLLSGPDLTGYRDLVVDLPRSYRDHLPNSLAFRGDDGRYAYLPMGSDTATGAPDSGWGNREETPLTAAILRFDLQQLLTRTDPLDVSTTASGGTYDPFAPGAPVTTYATGIRNAYDLVWHTNGQLYVPTNGSGANGRVPSLAAGATCATRTDGRVVVGPIVAPDSVPDARPDLLYRVEAGGYYGHPNVTRCEFVLNGGNPTAAADPLEVAAYPVGTLADPNYRGAVYDFGTSRSPNGVIEYLSPTFGGALRHALLVTRYSAGDDIVALVPSGSVGQDITARVGISGLSGFDNPLDITELVGPGLLYVIEAPASTTSPYATAGNRITLLRPDVAPTSVLEVSELVTSTVVGTSVGATLTITNRGLADVSVTGATVSGRDATAFTISTPLPVTVPQGATATLTVRFAPTGAQLDALEGQLVLATSLGQVTVGLFGLSTRGEGGNNEPALSTVLSTLGHRVDVGWIGLVPPTDPLGAAPKGEEVRAPRFRRAGPGAVTLTPLARFSPSAVAGIGWADTSTGTATDIASLPANPSQTLLPPVAPGGGSTFDPGSSVFAVHVSLPDRRVSTDDGTNTGAAVHGARVYPARNRTGVIIPNTYLVVFEEASNGDYQDYVLLLSNATPAG